MSKIVLGVTGGIAAYKAGDIIRGLKKQGFDVTCVMTKAAKEFITPLTLRKLSGNPVYENMFAEGKKTSSKIRHIDLARGCDAVLIAPATANVIGKIASGIADDLLTTTVMASKAKILIAPAMNTQMWKNRIVQSNVKKLKNNGYIFIGPAVGGLACGEQGQGHIEKVETIIRKTVRAVKKKTLINKTFLITSGATREYIDAVRFISNPSSGKTGCFLAAEAAARGAKVIFITGKTNFIPAGAKIVNVNSASDMLRAAKKYYKDSDVVIGAAAVGDYSLNPQASGLKSKKIPRKSALVLKLEPTKDILAELGKNKGKKKIAGFSAEAGKSLKRAKEKIKKKNLDMMIHNDITGKRAGFDSDTNKIVIMDKNGRQLKKASGTKEKLAGIIMDEIEGML